jgi:LemA protein
MEAINMAVLEVLAIVGGVVVAGGLAIFGWGVGTYNGFQIFDQNMKTQFSNVLTEYQRRIDLLLNLTKSVKSYKAHEKETLTEVIKARNGISTGDRAAQIKNLKGLDKTLSKLMLVVEQYPDLKASPLYAELMNNIKTTEDRINVGRTEYNDTVRDYNVMLKTFPDSIIAGMFRFAEGVYFETDESVKKAPVLDI